MSDQEWILASEDQKVIQQALIHHEEPFNLDLVNDGSVKISGHPPTYEDDDVIEHLIFHPLRANSLTFIYLSAAWNHNQLKYVLFVNDVPFAFYTTLGLSFIPKAHYAVGRLSAGFTNAYNMAIEAVSGIMNAPEPDSDGDNA